MDPSTRALIVGVVIGVILAIITYYIGKGQNFYIRMAGIIVGFAVVTLLLTGKVN